MACHCPLSPWDIHQTPAQDSEGTQGYRLPCSPPRPHHPAHSIPIHLSLEAFMPPFPPTQPHTLCSLIPLLVPPLADQGAPPHSRNPGAPDFDICAPTISPRQKGTHQTPPGSHRGKGDTGVGPEHPNLRSAGQHPSLVTSKLASCPFPSASFRRVTHFPPGKKITNHPFSLPYFSLEFTSGQAAKSPMVKTTMLNL